jgi:uncharacterized protein YcfJ
MTAVMKACHLIRRYQCNFFILEDVIMTDLKRELEQQKNSALPRVRANDDDFDISGKNLAIAQSIGRVAGALIGGIAGWVVGSMAGSSFYGLAGMALGGFVGNELLFAVASRGRRPNRIDLRNEQGADSDSPVEEISHDRMVALSRTIAINKVETSMNTQSSETLNFRRVQPSSVGSTNSPEYDSPRI